MLYQECWQECVVDVIEVTVLTNLECQNLADGYLKSYNWQRRYSTESQQELFVEPFANFETTLYSFVTFQSPSSSHSHYLPIPIIFPSPSNINQYICQLFWFSMQIWAGTIAMCQCYFVLFSLCLQNGEHFFLSWLILLPACHKRLDFCMGSVLIKSQAWVTTLKSHILQLPLTDKIDLFKSKTFFQSIFSLHLFTKFCTEYDQWIYFHVLSSFPYHWSFGLRERKKIVCHPDGKRKLYPRFYFTSLFYENFLIGICLLCILSWFLKWNDYWSQMLYPTIKHTPTHIGYLFT